MKRTRNIPRIIGAVVLCCTMGLVCALAAAQPSHDAVIYLDQAWSQGDREWYYNFSQGSSVLSYDIFLNLELADSQELFRSDANSERYGLIPQPANQWSNPDGLPIGISKTVISKPAWSPPRFLITEIACRTSPFAS